MKNGMILVVTFALGVSLGMLAMSALPQVQAQDDALNAEPTDVVLEAMSRGMRNAELPQAIAVFNRTFFEALQQEGFTEEQALAITANGGARVPLGNR